MFERLPTRICIFPWRVGCAFWLGQLAWTLPKLHLMLCSAAANKSFLEGPWGLAKAISGPMCKQRVFKIGFPTTMRWSHLISATGNRNWHFVVAQYGIMYGARCRFCKYSHAHSHQKRTTRHNKEVIWNECRWKRGVASNVGLQFGFAMCVCFTYQHVRNTLATKT